MNTVACGAVRQDGISISVINRTGSDISEIYFTGENDDEWGSDCLSSALSDQEEATVYAYSTDAEDIADGYALKLCDGSGETIGEIRALALREGDFITVYFEDFQFRYAVNQTYEDLHSNNLEALKSFYGLWKYEAYACSIAISTDGTWRSMGADGKTLSSGSYRLEGDHLKLSAEGKSDLSLSFDANGRLMDQDGGSDSGDYGTPYYWYDANGDVWYWNGSQDQYIGSGDDYYIDGDGYYESNDAGWDYDYDDYYYDDGQYYESNDADW